MAAKPHLEVFICSTRPGRVGLPVAEWFISQTHINGQFDLEVVDLAEVNLPFMDEPKHPRLGEYTHEHTRRWSARVNRADAFVFVMPEYNFGFNAPLKNAIDYLHNEWQYKPVGFVSYGGVAGGTRAVQMVKLVLGSLKMVPLVESVHIPFVFKHVSDGILHADETMDTAAHALLVELHRTAQAVRPLRGLLPQDAS